MDIKNIDADKVASASEADAGESLLDLRQALACAKSELGRVTTPAQVLVRQAREKSGRTQTSFAERIETSVATLRDSEHGRFAPPGGGMRLLRRIIKHPELSQELSAA